MKHERLVIIMFNKKFYVVACVENVRDVEIKNIYDGDVYTLDAILEGLKKKLQGLRIQVSILNDNAYIDIINNDNILEKTYSVVSKTGFVYKDSFNK